MKKQFVLQSCFLYVLPRYTNIMTANIITNIMTSFFPSGRRMHLFFLRGQ